MKKLLFAATALTMIGASATVFAAETKTMHKTPATAAKQAAPANTLLDVASANPDLSTFVKALKAAHWTHALSGPRHYTVLAPTNDAFSNMGSGKLDDLMKPAHRAELVALLRHHVVPGTVMSDKIKDGDSKLRAADGTSLAVKKSGSDITIGGADVTKADITASNGVIDEIGTVLTPPAPKTVSANAKDMAPKGKTMQSH